MAYDNQKQNNYIIQELVELFNKFPGIGPKSAQRLAYFTINQNHDEVKKFAETLLLVKEKIDLCAICQDFTIDQQCKCQDETKNKDLICVVEDPMDIIAIDNSNAYSGTFHVLHGGNNTMQTVDTIILALSKAWHMSDLLQALNLGRKRVIMVETTENAAREITDASETTEAIRLKNIIFDQK